MATTVRQPFWHFLISPRKIVVQHEVGQLRLRVEGFLDLAEEHAADDAAAAPHQRHPAVVELPPVLRRRRPHQHVTLGVADDLGRIQRLADRLDELRAIAADPAAAAL